MIDLARLEQYRENNRIEAKKALGGLPHSIWETYCAFANTLGGVILLGVEEWPDKSLHPVDLPAPEELARQFWTQLCDTRRVSVNILSEEQVRIHRVEGCRILAITVPRAQRFDRPVYMDADPIHGTYRRSGEGDYRCTREEVEEMLREAAVRTWDMEVLDWARLDSLDAGTVRRYRRRVERLRPGQGWKGLEEGDFLCRAGAAGTGADGRLRPTGAGLLLFGRGECLRAWLPGYRLVLEQEGRITLDTDGEGWNGNLFQFYFRALARLRCALAGQPEQVERCVAEALANCLSNAAYGSGEIRVASAGGVISMTNPGRFRMEVETARIGGGSDPRNAGLTRLFHLTGVGSGLGGGLAGIYLAWRERGWEQPEIREERDPERTTIRLALHPQEAGGASAGPGAGQLPVEQGAIIEYLTDRVDADAGQLARLLGADGPRVRRLLDRLEEQGVVTARGEGRERRYRLKG